MVTTQAPRIQLVRGAFHWQSGMAINADGAAHAYAPVGSGLYGLDNLANAGRPGNWWGIACNNDGAPYIQGASHPAPGYYVSTTALVDRSKAAGDPARYVDSATVPYITVPRELAGKRGVRMGDVGVAIYKGVTCGAIVADIGPTGHYGEGSMALAEALGIPSSPRTGGVAWGVTWLVWPGSSGGWPRSQASVDKQAGDLLATWGGIEATRNV